MLKPITFALGILLLSSTVFAQEGGFYLPDQLPSKPHNLTRAMAASVRFGDCSGVMLSRHGHLATNIHCLKECLSKSWDYTPAIDLEIAQQNGVFNFWRIFEQQPHQLECPRAAKTQYTNWEYSLSDPQVIWMGKGYFTHSELKILEIDENIFRAATASLEDIVIIKYQNLKFATPITCIPTRQKFVQSTEPLWAIGYPMRTTRISDFNSNGHSEYVSFGSERSSLKADPVLQSYAKQFPSDQVDTFWTLQSRLWDQPHILKTSIDAVSGNSGGMIIDENGNLTAIVFSVIKTSSEEYNGSTTLGLTLAHIRTQVRTQLGKEAEAEIFDCP